MRRRKIFYIFKTSTVILNNCSFDSHHVSQHLYQSHTYGLYEYVAASLPHQSQFMHPSLNNDNLRMQNGDCSSSVYNCCLSHIWTSFVGQTT